MTNEKILISKIFLNKEIIGEAGSLLGQMKFSVQCFSKGAKKCDSKGQQHLHMLAASIVGTNKVSDSMSPFFHRLKIGK